MLCRCAATLLLGAAVAAAQEIEVAGRVFDPRGDGLRSARVELRPLEPAHRRAELQLAGEIQPPAVTRTRTDRRGRFRLAAPAAGFWSVVVRHPEYLPAVQYLSPLLADRELADLEPRRRSELAARLTDGDGQPIAGASLVVAGWADEWREAAAGGWWPAERVVRTDSDGMVALPCASLEKVSIAALLEHRFLYQEASCEAGLLELAPPSGLNEVRLVHPDGAPAVAAYGFIHWPFLAFGVSDRLGRVRGPLSPNSSPSSVRGDLPLVPLQGNLPVAFADAMGYYSEPRWLAPPEDDDPASDGSAKLELPATVSLHGRVVGATSGQPVEDVWLWLGRGSRYFQRLRHGIFELRMPSTAAVQFGGPGYLTIAYQPPDDGADLLVRMIPAMTLIGRIVDLEGNAVAGAEITGERGAHHLWERRLRELHGDKKGAGRWQLDAIDAVSDEHGIFELRRLPPQQAFELRVARSGFAVHREVVQPLVPGEPASELVITLEQGYAGFGRVVDQGELPIGGAEVALLPSLTGAADEQDFEVRENYRATTGSEGWFTLRDLPAGTFYLSAKATGFPELLVPGIEIADSVEPIDLGTMVLVPGVLLTGRVVGGDGEPVAGAQLSLRDADGEQIVVQRAGSPWFASTTSLQDGSFRISGLPVDRRLVLLVSSDGFLPREIALPLGSDDVRLDVELSHGARVSGVVLAPGGRPAAGVEVDVRPGPSLQRLATATSRTVETDDRGRFEASGLRPGEYHLVARRGAAESETLRRQVPVEGLAGLHLELRRKASLRVTALDPLGRAVARAFLILEPQGDPSPEGPAAGRSAFERTDPAGVAVFQPIGAGVYRIMGRHPEFEPFATTIEVADGAARELELRFAEREVSEEHEAKFEVSGRVVDPSGLPVSGAEVWLTGSRGVRPVASGADGGFELTAPPGEYRLGCRHPGFAVYSGEPFTLDRVDLSGRVVELSEGATVTGHVTGLEADDLARLVIVARGPSARRYYGTVNFEGELRIEGLAAGRWLVRAEQLNPTRAAAEHVEIGRGESEVYVELHFEAGYRLTGSVLRLGRPLAGSTVAVRCTGEFRGKTFTDVAGRFAVDHLPAGRCTVSVTDPESGHVAGEDIEIASDAEVMLEVAVVDSTVPRL